MPVTSKVIDKYSVSVISDAEPNQFAATVWLFGTDGKVIAFLRFYNPGTPLAPNEFREDLDHPLISYPASALPCVVDVLRNEKPVYFTWFDYRPVRCFGAVETSREPIGEAES